MSEPARKPALKKSDLPGKQASAIPSQQGKDMNAVTPRYKVAPFALLLRYYHNMNLGPPAGHPQLHSLIRPAASFHTSLTRLRPSDHASD